MEYFGIEGIEDSTEKEEEIYKFMKENLYVPYGLEADTYKEVIYCFDEFFYHCDYLEERLIVKNRLKACPILFNGLPTGAK